jgi:hypothetical protein
LDHSWEKKWPNLFLKKFQINFTKNRKDEEKKKSQTIQRKKSGKFPRYVLTFISHPKKNKEKQIDLDSINRKGKVYLYSVFPLSCSVYEIVISNCLDKLNKIGFHYNDDSILWDFFFFFCNFMRKWMEEGKLGWGKF